MEAMTQPGWVNIVAKTFLSSEIPYVERFKLIHRKIAWDALKKFSEPNCGASIKFSNFFQKKMWEQV